MNCLPSGGCSRRRVSRFFFPGYRPQDRYSTAIARWGRASFRLGKKTT
jgi:hypothetical protein